MPTELQGEMAHAAAEALPVWVEARKNSDFKAFLPHLELNLELKRRYIECFDARSVRHPARRLRGGNEDLRGH